MIAAINFCAKRIFPKTNTYIRFVKGGVALQSEQAQPWLTASVNPMNYLCALYEADEEPYILPVLPPPEDALCIGEGGRCVFRFNAGEILEETGKAPVRSYYCPLCCGYHVTSNPSRDEGESMDERDEGMIRQIDAAVKRRLEAPALAKNLSEPIAASIEKARLLMSELRLDEARALLLDVLCDIKIGQAEKSSWKGKGDELRLRAEKCLSLMDEFEAAGKDPVRAEEIRSSTSKSRNVALLQAMLANAARLEKLDGMIASIKGSLEDGAPLEELLSMIEEAREKVRD